MLRSSFPLVARRNLPSRWGRKPALLLVLAGLAGCGGGGEQAAQTQKVRGDGYAFVAPAAWKITRSSHVVSVAPSPSEPELISVSTYRLSRRPTLKQVDSSVEALARRLRGRVVSTTKTTLAGRPARRFALEYARGEEQLGLRLTFLFKGRLEFQLLCRWRRPPNEEIASACDRLAASFRPA
jgi:hypothetical protein